MNNRERDGKKKKSGAGWIIAAIVVFLFNTIGESGDISGGDLVPVLMIVFIIAAIIFAVYAGIKAAKKYAAGFTSGFSSVKKTAGIGAERIKASFTREEKSPELFTRPSAPARQDEKPRYYDENAAAVNFERDRQRRLAQLEVFLKNGIIGREEYRMLHDRYERNL